jgi:hypothetical protein
MVSIELPDDPEELRALALRQHEQLDAQSEEIRVLREYVRLLKYHRFGHSSEKSSDEQIRLFNEAEVEAADAEAEDDAPLIVAAHTRRKRGRKPLPDWIPRVEIVHDLPDEQKVCKDSPRPVLLTA